MASFWLTRVLFGSLNRRECESGVITWDTRILEIRTFLSPPRNANVQLPNATIIGMASQSGTTWNIFGGTSKFTVHLEETEKHEPAFFVGLKQAHWHTWSVSRLSRLNRSQIVPEDCPCPWDNLLKQSQRWFKLFHTVSRQLPTGDPSHQQEEITDLPRTIRNPCLQNRPTNWPPPWHDFTTPRKSRTCLVKFDDKNY